MKIDLSFAALLFLLFLALKLTDYIDWSWWFVTAPLWIIPVGFFLFAMLMLLVAGICAISIFLIDWACERKQ